MAQEIIKESDIVAETYFLNFSKPTLNAVIESSILALKLAGIISDEIEDKIMFHNTWSEEDKKYVINGIKAKLDERIDLN